MYTHKYQKKKKVVCLYRYFIFAILYRVVLLYLYYIVFFCGFSLFFFFFNEILLRRINWFNGSKYQVNFIIQPIFTVNVLTIKVVDSNKFAMRLVWTIRFKSVFRITSNQSATFCVWIKKKRSFFFFFFFFHYLPPVGNHKNWVQTKRAAR